MKKDRDNRDKGEKKGGRDASPATPEVEVRPRTVENAITAKAPKITGQAGEFNWQAFRRVGAVLFLLGLLAVTVPTSSWKDHAKAAKSGKSQQGLSFESCKGPIVDVTGLEGDFHFFATTCVQFDLARGGTPWLVLPPRNGATFELRELTPNADNYVVVQKKGDPQEIKVRRGEHFAFGNNQPELAVRYTSGKGFYLFIVSKPEVEFR